MRIDNERLARLSSIKEVEMAQRQVRRSILRQERKIRGNYQSAKDEFSLKNATLYGIEVIDTVQSVIRYARQTYDTVSGRRRRRACFDDD